ncbi:MAG: Lrp/AsnC family transcriptional regulator [Candidatus Bathyarchaeia archaeon]
MCAKSQLDEIDVTILSILIEDARSSLKEIAKRCRLTSSAVLRRIKRLKQEGIIVGTRFVVDPVVFGFPFYATLLIDAADSLEPKAKKMIREMQNVIICAESIGRYNLCALIRGRDIEELKKITSTIKNIRGINRVAINIWGGETYYNYAKTLKQTITSGVDNNGRS